MRKLKLQVQMTIDGFISGTNGEMDWMKFPWSDDINEYVQGITDSVDTILLGRKLAEGFIPHWTTVANDPNNPEQQSGIKFSTTPKIVFSKTMNASIWDNSIVSNGDLSEEVMKLKHQDGNDIIAYGGGSFVSSLIKHTLIDELHLFINPSAIGSGMPIFKELTGTQGFEIKDVKQFECGIVALVYTPVR